MIHGRERERRLLAERTSHLTQGTGFSVLLEGPAGIGKTTLLEEAAGAAGAVARLQACGYASEIEMPFGGLLGLLAPVLGHRGELVDSQRRALEVALALTAPAPFDPFALRLAVASLLAAAAEEQPVLVTVDDAQWLDEDSLEAVLFAARRPAGPGVGILLAARAGEGTSVSAVGIEHIPLAPLDDAAARALLGDGAPLAPSVRQAILLMSAGNPLALRELPQSLSTRQRRGEQSLGAALPAEGRLVEAFARELADLPEDETVALCVVAAASGNGADPIEPALTALDLPADAVLERLATRGLVVTGARGLRLRHPLMASVAYHRQPSSTRRAVHRALGTTTDDAGRRAWHLAHAVSGPDAEVAALLAEVGAAARARGAHVEAGRTLARAAELSPEPAAAARLRVEATQDFAVAGHGAAALALAERAGADEAPAEVRAAAQHLRAHLLMRGGDPATALAILEQLAAQASAAGDQDGAAQLLLEASMTHMFGGDMHALLDSAARAAEQTRDASPQLHLVATLVSGEALVALGRAADGDALIARAAPLLLDPDPLSPIAEVIGMGAMASMWIERFDRAERPLDVLIDRARAASAAGRLPYALAVRSQLRWRRGRWPAALSDAQEAVQLARDTGQDGMLAVALPALVRAEAGRGRLERAREHAREGVAVGEAAAGDATVVHSLAALGFAELTDGRPGEAAVVLDRAAEIAARYDHGEPALTLFAGDHIEALARAGRREDAQAALARLDAQARRTGGAWAAAVAARGRVLLAPADAVDGHAADALAAHARVDMPFELARTQLAIGERLRRERRRGDARAPLSEALARFERLGAAPWQARARAELEVGSGAAAEAGDAPLDELTPHELQIALLVAGGSSNPDVAAALFLSRKTVEYHLSAIYRKLGLRSRTQLAAYVAEVSPPGA